MTLLEEALKEFDIRKPPAALVRFFRGKYGLSTLVTGRLKFTPPREFNDPFEFSPGIDPKLTLVPDALRKHFLAPHGFPRKVYCQKYAGGDEAKYAKWVESAVARPDLFAAHIQCMRQAVTNGISDSFGVVCFSAFPESDLHLPSAVRHWSAYADDHHGMAIEFNGEHSFFAGFVQSKLIFDVRYEEERPICKPSDFEDCRDLNLLRMLRAWGETKSEKAWGQENEWRLIMRLGEDEKMGISRAADGERIAYFIDLWKSGDLPHDTSEGKVIRRVILGSRASSELEASVRATRNEPHLQHIELFRAREDPQSFSMRIERI